MSEEGKKRVQNSRKERWKVREKRNNKEKEMKRKRWKERERLDKERKINLRRSERKVKL